MPTLAHVFRIQCHKPIWCKIVIHFCFLFLFTPGTIRNTCISVLVIPLTFLCFLSTSEPNQLNWLMCQYPEFTMDICQLCPNNITQTFSSTCVTRNIQIFQARFCRGWLGGGLCQLIARLTDFVRCCGNNWLPILASSLSTWFFNYSSSEFHHLHQRSLLWDWN